MANYDSFAVVEEWISEHYFTSDDKGTTFNKKVRALANEWADEKKEGRPTPVSRFSEHRAELMALVAGLNEQSSRERFKADSHEVSQLLRQILGLPADETVVEFERGDTIYEVTTAQLGGEAPSEVIWLTAMPVDSLDASLADTTLIGLNQIDGKDRPTSNGKDSVAKLLSDLYLSANAPKYAVVSAGGYLFLTEAERWPEGRYLVADIQLVAERNETKKAGEIEHLLAMFSRNSLVPREDGSIWWDERLQESVQHAVGVSKDLRDGIRESIEIIANNVLERRCDQDLPIDGVDGQVLARQTLRFLYRILFLLYAEASPQLGVLPKGTGEYDLGYGLDRLQDLVQVELSQASRHGTHIYESLHLLFTLVNGTHPSQQNLAPAQPVEEHDDDGDGVTDGLRFEPLKADLFNAEATSLIDEVGLSNGTLQQVLERLLLTKRTKGDRGFISYANLGINQLGAVYEGLMSYTGFIAEEDLYEVAKNGDPSDGSWVIPLDKAEEIDEKHFVTREDEVTGEKRPVLHRKGAFVFRLAGRERQQSASYYSPEVITQFVVSQALEELFDADTAADDILKITVCEPALGSGAFAIEAVRQLATEYLERKQKELGQEIPAEEYPEELQRVKAQVALHQIYGVDLNDTAVELAEVSLWLDTMQPGLHAPWFGLRLRRGNSLIGARRATYGPTEVKKKAYLKSAPENRPLTGLAQAMDHGTVDPAVSGEIHQFLLPGEGWGAAADAKQVKRLAAEEQKKLKSWRNSTRNQLTAGQINRLAGLSERVETLWAFVLKRMQIAEAQAARFIDYWPHEREASPSYVTREEIEESLADLNGAYQRLKRVMDAWAALWIWPLTETEIEPPTIEDWLDALEALLGNPGDAKKRAQEEGIAQGATWNELDTLEQFDLQLSSAQNVSRALAKHPWLNVTERIAQEQGFFHWELDFATVFAKGGFDFQVGNPPWVRPTWVENDLYAESDPWWHLAHKPTQAQKKAKRAVAESSQDFGNYLVGAAGSLQATRAFVGSGSNYRLLAGLQPDLYRVFMERTWANAGEQGIVSLVHPESHFTEQRAASLRRATYHRLRRHWQFINELVLYEIDGKLRYGVHVYGSPQKHPDFMMATSLYHPETVVRSLKSEGGAFVPAIKDEENNWDTRPHPDRILRVDEGVLETWRDVLEAPDVSPLEARMVYLVNRQSQSVLAKMAHAPRIAELGLHSSTGWHEASDRRKGYFEVGSAVNDSWDKVIIQGPFFSVANPFAKEPNPTMANNLDYTEIDLEALPADFIPRTSYQPAVPEAEYDRAYGTWDTPDGPKPIRDFYRVAWRSMAALANFRTVYPTLIPPGSAHVHAVHCLGGQPRVVLDAASMMSALSSDFLIRLTGLGNLHPPTISKTPTWGNAIFLRNAVSRYLKLVCLTDAYASLYGEVTGEPWTPDIPVRLAAEREQLLGEIDALAALDLGLTLEELVTIYRTQFAVMRQYERQDYYDANGRKVPDGIRRLYDKVGEDGMELADRTWTHPQSNVEYVFEFPFRHIFREDIFTEAYHRFKKELDETGTID